ncbi:MAG: CRTAC1 family protein [Candidatus Solibacter sp.]
MSRSLRLGLATSLGIILLGVAVKAQNSKRPAAPPKSLPAAARPPARVASRALPELEDITASTGIRFNHLASPDKKYIVESMSGGVALIDYDRDGWPDIYFTNAPDVEMQLAGKKARSALFHNERNGKFSDVSEKAGVAFPCWANGAAVGDYNNDGWPDLLVTCFGGVVLYSNRGNGTFDDVTKAAGLGADSAWAMGAAFGDYDGDGFHDLFVSHYAAYDLRDLPAFGSMVNCTYYTIKVQCGPAGLPGAPDNLYHNNGDGTFTEVAKQAGVDDAQKLLGLTAVWSDLDNDGKLELFVTNDGAQNYLYRNEGNGNEGKGRFKEVAYQAGVALDENGKALANMGLAVGDYLHSGLFGIAITHFSDQYLQLFRNDGNLNFTDVSNVARIARATVHYVGWGDAFYDYDNDGWLDLIAVNGHVYPQVDAANIGVHYREPGLLFVNQRDGTFLDASEKVGPALKVPRPARGLAVGDLFNDGNLEVVVENLEGEPVIFRTKGGAPHHWIGFELAGRQGNRLALNARVKVTAGSLVQTDEVRSSGSYLSQNDLRLHFGLGDVRLADRVEVRWPSGKIDNFVNFRADRIYCILEGAGEVPCAEFHTGPESSVK